MTTNLQTQLLVEVMHENIKQLKTFGYLTILNDKNNINLGKHNDFIVLLTQLEDELSTLSKELCTMNEATRIALNKCNGRSAA